MLKRVAGIAVLIAVGALLTACGTVKPGESAFADDKDIYTRADATGTAFFRPMVTRGTGVENYFK